MLGYLFAWAIGRSVVGALEDIGHNQRKQMQMQLREQKTRLEERENVYIQQNITNNVQVNHNYMGMTKEEFEKEMQAYEEFVLAPRKVGKR